jgi:hypothetical protein
MFKGDRKNQNVGPLSVLFADLDNYKDSGVPLRKLWPHAFWKTSEVNAQGVWFLSAPEPDYDSWADLNQRLTYFLGADRGGWHGSKLLRVPESMNNKYDPPQKGKAGFCMLEAAPYEAEALRALLPSVERGSEYATPCPDTLTPEEWKPYLATVWHKLPLSVRSDLLTSKTDRSKALVSLANKMLRAGLNETEVFHILWGTSFNKFRTPSERPHMLWKLINY